jgi:hypothetical protein
MQLHTTAALTGSASKHCQISGRSNHQHTRLQRLWRCSWFEVTDQLRSNSQLWADQRQLQQLVRQWCCAGRVWRCVWFSRGLAESAEHQLTLLEQELRAANLASK